MSESERRITTSVIVGGATAANITVRDFIDDHGDDVHPDDADSDTVMLAIKGAGINVSLFGTLEDLIELGLAAVNKLGDLAAARDRDDEIAEDDEPSEDDPEIEVVSWGTPREPGNS